MMAALAPIMLASIDVNGLGRLALSLPLCLSIAIVYKTTRCEHVREIPMAALGLWITIVITMYAIGVGLWMFFQIMA